MTSVELVGTLRPDNRRDILELFPKGGVIAELGVFRGVYSERILERCQPKLLYLVDLWGSRVDWWIDGDVRSVSGGEAYHCCCSKFESNHVVRMRRESTIDFLASMPDRSLDVVYLDADHGYCSVRDELALAWPRMKPGGWISGHDYCDLFPGVVQAVSEFIELHGLRLDVLTKEIPGIVINCPGGPKEMAYNSFAIKVPVP